MGLGLVQARGRAAHRLRKVKCGREVRDTTRITAAAAQEPKRRQRSRGPLLLRATHRIAYGDKRVEIAGYRVKADTALLFGRLAVQRERTLLESLLAFKPDRFSPESANSRGGPIWARICRRGRPPRR